MRYLYLLTTVVLISLLSISACGRKGEPRPPEKINSAAAFATAPTNGGGRK